MRSTLHKIDIYRNDLGRKLSFIAPAVYGTNVYSILQQFILYQMKI